jgi:3-isopropylmalate/(R)-2-methylmalate dehydratase large subunit
MFWRQTLLLGNGQNVPVVVDGMLGAGVTPRDLILHIIGVVGTLRRVT